MLRVWENILQSHSIISFHNSSICILFPTFKLFNTIFINCSPHWFGTIFNTNDNINSNANIFLHSLIDSVDQIGLSVKADTALFDINQDQSCTWTMTCRKLSIKHNHLKTQKLSVSKNFLNTNFFWVDKKEQIE